MLLLEAGRAVSVRRLETALWADNPPSTARSQVQICISALRRLLSGTGAAILTRPPGYLLRIPDSSLDLWRFRELCFTADSVARQRPEEARARYREALALWRGEACCSVASELVMQAAIRLNEERWGAIERRMDLELRLGRHQEVAAELAYLVAAEPLRERPRALLMLALYRSGRQAEALQVFRSGRQLLVEDLGIDPGRTLRALEHAILTCDPALDIRSGQAPAISGPGRLPATVPVPRQLPASAPDFVGRDDLVQLACKVFRQSRDAIGETIGEAGAVPVVLLTGRGGIGKTTLALDVAHTIRDDFPDGQLFARLRHNGGTAANPSNILEQFLSSLGVPTSGVPASAAQDQLEARAAMFRSRLAGHRVLIVLDDVDGISQVEPLLPGVSGCGVIITSRARPAPAGAVQLDVGVLDPSAAAELLNRMIGADRTAAEPEAFAELIRLCEGFPLALRIVGSKLAARRHWRVSRMAERLGDEQRRLDELDLEGASVRATLEFSYLSLPRTARVLLNRLGQLDQLEFPAWISAPLLALPVTAAEDVLEDLVTAGLVEARIAHGGKARYRMQEMVRIFAREKLSETPGSGGRAGGELSVNWILSPDNQL
jgi:DNA-binding SARP family transcriptional activator/predicted ATPase